MIPYAEKSNFILQNSCLLASRPQPSTVGEYYWLFSLHNKGLRYKDDYSCASITCPFLTLFYVTVTGGHADAETGKRRIQIYVCYCSLWFVATGKLIPEAGVLVRKLSLLNPLSKAKQANPRYFILFCGISCELAGFVHRPIMWTLSPR
jgi:hypothetical protein